MAPLVGFRAEDFSGEAMSDHFLSPFVVVLADHLAGRVFKNGPIAAVVPNVFARPVTIQYLLASGCPDR